MHEQKNVKIEISALSVFRAVMVLIFFWILFIVKDLVLVVFAAIVIASSIEPAKRWFAKYKIRRLPAVIIIYVSLGLLLAGFFIFFLPAVLDEAVHYLNNLPENLSFSDFWSPIKDSSFFAGNQTVQNISENFSVKQVTDGFRSVIAGTGEGIFKTASVIFGGVLSFILILVLSFYLSVQEDGVTDFLRIITPYRHEEYIVDLWKRAQRKIGYWLQGQLLLGLIVGVLVYLGLIILRVDHALLLASLAAMFELIPIFGPILASIPAILIAVGNQGVSTGFFVVGLYVIIHQFENHLLYPLVVKKIIGVSPIVVILSLVIGGKLAGFLGIILSVPISTVFMEYINDIEKRKSGRAAERAAQASQSNQHV